MRSFLSLVGVAAWLTVLPAPTHAADSASADKPIQKFPELLATPLHLEELRKGGYTLYLRHTKTDTHRSDRVPTVDLDDCSTQRPITEEGRQLTTRVGVYIRKARIPVSEVYASPLCRVRDTMAAAFPKLAYTVDNQLMYLANLTAEQKKPIIAQTRQLLAGSVSPGTNRLLVAHAPNLMELIGYFPKEATLVVFRPDSHEPGFEYVASIPPDHWPELMRMAGSK